MTYKAVVVLGVVLSLGAFMDGNPQFPTMQGFPYKPSASTFQERTFNSQSFPPRASSHIFPPRASSHVFPPRATLQTFPPGKSSQVFPPRASSQVFPPRSSWFSSTSRFAVPSSPQAESVGNGKNAIVYTNRYGTYSAALNACKSLPYPGASLFTVNGPQDSAWLGRRINYEKDWVTGSSKFWVGLNSLNTAGALRWVDQNAYTNDREVVQVSGYDDPEKVFAWAVPDGGSRLKYEFLTPSDEAEAFICQYSA